MNHLIRIHHDWPASPLRVDSTPEPTDVFWAKCECGWRMNLTYDQYEDERIYAALALKHDKDTGLKPGNPDDKTEAR